MAKNHPLCFSRMWDMRLLIFLFAIPFLATSQQKAQQKFLALGDSYTIGESVSSRERWPSQLVDSLQKRNIYFQQPRIIATTGWRTEDLDRAVHNENLSHDYDLVSLLIGVNDFYQGVSVDEYKPRFEKLLREAIALAGGRASHVFVVSIPDYAFTPFGESRRKNISPGIDAFNTANRDIAGVFSVRYVDVTAISRRGLKEPALVADDGLHPSSRMYAEWVCSIIGSLGVDQ